jgi:hypothetical protein
MRMRGRWGFGGLASEIFSENIEPKIFISEAILLVIFELQTGCRKR